MCRRLDDVTPSSRTTPPAAASVRRRRMRAGGCPACRSGRLAGPTVRTRAVRRSDRALLAQDGRGRVIPAAPGPAAFPQSPESRHAALKIWIDMTAPAHPIVFRPVIQRLREAGHEVKVSARDYAQTLQLLDLHRIEHERFGSH